MSPERRSSAHPQVKKLSSTTTTPPDWLVGGFVGSGSLTLLGGDPGATKSMLLYDLAARLTTARPLPGTPPRDPCEVLVIHPEDHHAVVQQRIAAAEGEPDRIDIVDQAGPDLDRPFDLSTDLANIRALAEHHHYGLIIIENLGLVLGEASNTEARTRVAMHGLHNIAEQTDTPIVAIVHLTKANRRQALHAGSGRVAQAGSARSVTIVAPDPDDTNLRVWASAKNNAGPTPPSLVYEIDDTPFGPAVKWLGTSEWSADDLLRTKSSDRAPKLAEAQQMLWEMLADGPIRQSDIKRVAVLRGIGWRTVEQAKAALGVRSHQTPQPGVRGRGPASWTLPATEEGDLP